MKVTPASGDASPVSDIDTTISVAIDDFGATTQYSGLAPGFVGVFQFNIQVPTDLPVSGQFATMKVIIGAIPANTTYLWVTKPFGTLTIGPAPDYVLTWNTNGFSNAEVFVTADDGPEALVAQGATGSVSASFITAGHLYTFNLRSFDSSTSTVGDIIASVTVDTR